MAQYDLVFVRNNDSGGLSFGEILLPKPAESGMFLTQHPSTGALSWSKYHWDSASGNLTSSISGNFGLGIPVPLQKLDVAGDINVPNGMGLRINNTAGNGHFLRGNGIRFTSSLIQAGDLPSHNHNQAGGWVYNGNDEIYSESAVTKVNIGNSSGSAALNIHGSCDDPSGEIFICDTSQNTPYPLYLGQNRRSHSYTGLSCVYGSKGGDELLISGLAEEPQTYHKFMYGKYVYDSGTYYKQGLLLFFDQSSKDCRASFFGHEHDYSLPDARFTLYNDTASSYPALRIIDPSNNDILEFNIDSNDVSYISSSRDLEIISSGQLHAIAMDILLENGNTWLSLTNSGIGINITSPSALLHLASGSSSKAPVMLSSGALLQSPVLGAVEWDGGRLYVTNSSRQTIAFKKDFGLLSSQTSVINANSASVATNLIGTDVGSNTIPSGSFSPGDQLLTKISGVYNTLSNSQNITLKVLLNTTELLSISGTLPGGASNWVFTGESILTIKSTGSSGKCFLTGSFFMESRSLGYSLQIPLTSTSEIDINTSQSNTLYIQALWANSGNSLKSIQSSVQLLNVN